MDGPRTIIVSGTVSAMRELQRALGNAGLTTRIVAGDEAPKSA